MIEVSKDLLSALDACTEGYREGIRLGVIGSDWGEAINVLEQNGQLEFAQWMREQRHTKLFIELTGGRFMEKYHLFNTFTGQHETFVSKAELDQRYLELATQVLAVHGPSIAQAFSNDAGDETWVPLTPPNTQLQIVQS